MTGNDTAATTERHRRESDGTGSRDVLLNGEPVEIGPDTTAGELREAVGVGSEAVFTHRSPDGINALTDDDVIARHVDDGAEIQTQPLADSEVFGTA